MDQISWDDYFLGLAFVVAEKSKDAQTKHGCILVDKKTNQILSLGYNGPPRNCKDDSKIPKTRPEKYLWMAHAEANAIFNCRQKSDDMVAYVTGQCCPTCLLSLWQFGVKEVIMVDGHGSFTIGGEERSWMTQFVWQTGLCFKKVKPNLDWLNDVLTGRASEFITKCEHRETTDEIIADIERILQEEEKEINEDFISGFKRVWNYWFRKK
jgi:dCMP deaminase